VNSELIEKLKSLGFEFTKHGDSIDDETSLASITFSEENLKKAKNLIETLSEDALSKNFSKANLNFSGEKASIKSK
jgi:hypothetical protein